MKKALRFVAFVTFPIWIIPAIALVAFKDGWESFNKAMDEAKSYFFQHYYRQARKKLSKK